MILSKPKGMLETIHLFDLIENPQTKDLWGLLGESYHFKLGAATIDKRTGEISCELLGSLVDYN